MLTGTYYTCVFDMPNSADEGARGARPDESLTSSDSEKEVCVCMRTCVCLWECAQFCIQKACSQVSKLMQPRCLTCLDA